jgi:hypothetical protein
MRMVIKRILFLHEKHGLNKAELFNRLIDMAAGYGVDYVMADLPPEYRTQFHDWIDNLSPLDTLINVKSGPLSDREKSNIRAIRDWLDCHPGGAEPPEEAGTAANGSGETDPSLPIVTHH